MKHNQKSASPCELACQFDAPPHWGKLKSKNNPARSVPSSDLGIPRFPLLTAGAARTEGQGEGEQSLAERPLFQIKNRKLKIGNAHSALDFPTRNEFPKLDVASIFQHSAPPFSAKTTAEILLRFA